MSSALLVATALLGSPVAIADARETPTAVVIFVAPPRADPPRLNAPSLFDHLAGRPELSLGLVNATQSSYSATQTLLDISQGTRVSRSTYTPTDDPVISLARDGAGGHLGGWTAARVRARTAPAPIDPGALAGSLPGGAAYVTTRADHGPEAIVAADRGGHVASLSRGPTTTIAARTATAQQHRRLVVVNLPARPQGLEQLDEILAARHPRELVIVIQTPPVGGRLQLLRAAITAGDPAGTMTSATTRRHGLIAAIDVLPTVLRHLGVARPDSVRGEPITIQPGRSQSELQNLSKRLGVIGGRRTATIATLLLAWLGVGLALTTAGGPRGAFAARRIGALAVMWIPTTVLLSAIVQPARAVEMLIVVGGAFVLAAITDRVLAWPRAPLAPIAIAAVAYTIDLARDSVLTTQSLLGSNPRSGARFYGVGNELEAVLSVLVLLGVAAALHPGSRSRRGAAAFALAGIIAAAIIGAGRLGADVGAVITLGTGAGVATVLMLPGGVSRRAVACAIFAPALAIAGLAGLDLVTGANGHFTRTVLHARSIGDLLDTLVRRYELAFSVLKGGAMPLLVIVCLLAIAYAIRFRGRIYAPVDAGDAWRAGLGGGLGCAAAGALFNDSGPLLLIISVFVLTCASAYLSAPPPGAPSSQPPRADVTAPAQIAEILPTVGRR